MLNMNPKQIGKAATDALALIQAISDKPNQEVVGYLKSLEEKTKQLEASEAKVRSTVNIVDTLAEAERLKAEAAAMKEAAARYCEDTKQSVNAKAEEVRDQADQYLLDAENAKKRAEDILGPLEADHAQKLEALDKRLREVSLKEAQCRDFEQELDRRERALKEKIEKAQALLS